MNKIVVILFLLMLPIGIAASNIWALFGTHFISKEEFHFSISISDVETGEMISTFPYSCSVLVTESLGQHTANIYPVGYVAKNVLRGEDYLLGRICPRGLGVGVSRDMELLVGRYDEVQSHRVFYADNKLGTKFNATITRREMPIEGASQVTYEPSKFGNSYSTFRCYHAMAINNDRKSVHRIELDSKRYGGRLRIGDVTSKISATTCISSLDATRLVPRHSEVIISVENGSVSALLPVRVGRTTSTKIGKTNWLITHTGNI